MGQCWLSVRLFFGGQHSRRHVGLLAMGECWLSVGLFFDGQHSRRDVGPRTDAIGLQAGAGDWCGSG